MLNYILNSIKNYSFIFSKTIVLVISLIFSKLFYILSIIVSGVKGLFKKFFQIFHFIFYNSFRLLYFIYEMSLGYFFKFFFKISLNIYSFILFYLNYINLYFLLLKNLVIKLSSDLLDYSRVKKFNYNIFLLNKFINIFFKSWIIPIILSFYYINVIITNFLKLFFINAFFYIKNLLFFNFNFLNYIINLTKNLLFISKKIYYNYIIEFLLKIKNLFYLTLNKIKLLLKRKFPSVYTLYIYARPGYIFFVIYLYLILVFPALFLMNQTILNSFFDLTNDWSWYGTIYPISENILNYFFDYDLINMYMNKKVWFFKFGDHADLYLLNVFLSIFYFLVMVPYFKQIWFDEDNWDNLVNDIDEDEEGWDDEHDFEDIDEGVDFFEGEQNGEELFEYYDDLRDKSYIKGRFRNFTVANGHIVPGEIGWGFFLSYWIFTFYYAIKLMFWPEIPMIAGFPGIDLGETAPGLFTFLETYPQYNLQIYSGWMPGSPLQTIWQGSNLLDSRIGTIDLYKYNWALWNKRLKEGFLDFSPTFGRTATPFNVGFLDYDQNNTREYMFQDFETYFTSRKPISSTDIWNEVYGTYPIVYSDLNFWKRSVVGVRSFLNPLYNNGHNYLYFWPKGKDFTSYDYGNLNIHEWYLNNKSEHVFDNSLTRKDFRYYGNNIDLDRLYFFKVLKTNEPYDFPLTYSQKRRNNTFTNKFLQGFNDYNTYYTSVVDSEARQYDQRNDMIFVVYDYGLTPFHLDLEHNWWYWMDKPITSNQIYAKGFLNYLYELQKNMDNSYNRWAILKLWYTYWEGHFKVSQLFYADKVAKWNYYGDLFSIHFLGETREGSNYIGVEPSDKSNSYSLVKKQLDVLESEMPFWSEILQYEYFDYLINDFLVGNTNSKILKNTYLYNPQLSVDEIQEYKDNFHNTVYSVNVPLLHFTFLESDIGYETSRFVNLFFKFGDFYSLRETGQTRNSLYRPDLLFMTKHEVYYEDFEVFGKVSNFLYGNLMNNSEPLFGLRGLPYNSASISLDFDIDDKKYELFDTNLQHLFFLRFTYVKSELLENLVFNNLSKLWVSDFYNYNLNLLEFPNVLPSNLFLSYDNFILPKTDKLYLIKQTVEVNEPRKPFFFEYLLKVLLSNFYIDYDLILEKLQNFRLDLGFFSKKYIFHYVYINDFSFDLNVDFVNNDFIVRDNFLEKEHSLVQTSSTKREKDIVYYATKDLNDRKIIPYYFRDLSFQETISIVNFFDLNRNLIDFNNKLSLKVNLGEYNYYDIKYLNTFKNLSYDLSYNIYLYKSFMANSSLVTVSELNFLNQVEYFYISNSLKNSNLDSYITDFWAGDMLVWYIMTYDIDILLKFSDYSKLNITEQFIKTKNII